MLAFSAPGQVSGTGKWIVVRAQLVTNSTDIAVAAACLISIGTHAPHLLVGFAHRQLVFLATGGLYLEQGLQLLQ